MKAQSVFVWVPKQQLGKTIDELLHGCLRCNVMVDLCHSFIHLLDLAEI